MTPDKKQESINDTLNRAMGFFNWRGRVLLKEKDHYVMAGIKFNNMDEVNKAIDAICKALNKSIR